MGQDDFLEFVVIGFGKDSAVDYKAAVVANIGLEKDGAKPIAGREQAADGVGVLEREFHSVVLVGRVAAGEKEGEADGEEERDADQEEQAALGTRRAASRQATPPRP